MTRSTCANWSLIAAAMVVASARAEVSLIEARATLEKWVETRQLISKTKGEWQSDKEMLEQSVQLLDREIKSVEDQLTKAGVSNTQVEKERAQAEASLKLSSESLEQTRRFASDLEGKIIRLVPQLPAPLQEILKPLLVRLPVNSESTKMFATERVQVMVGILNELDKFNNAVSIFSDKRKNEKGEELAVETVYVGLGAAYFVNDTANFGGVGSPGIVGWQWTVRREVAVPVREVIRIYRNERPARFISLPIAIK